MAKKSFKNSLINPARASKLSAAEGSMPSMGAPKVKKFRAKMAPNKANAFATAYRR